MVFVGHGDENEKDAPEGPVLYQTELLPLRGRRDLNPRPPHYTM